MALAVPPTLSGDGTKLDDFNYDAELVRLLKEIIPARAGWPATLVINGDFIDFPQIFPQWGMHQFGDRFECTEAESVKKTDGKSFLWERLRGVPPEDAVSIAASARVTGIDETERKRTCVMG